MLDTILNLGLRALYLLFGVGAFLAILRWSYTAVREKRERWAVFLAFGMLLLAGVYTAGHALILMNREQIEEGRERYSRFGDPRASEMNRGDLKGWILDCTGKDANALARYGMRDGEVQRVYPLGEAGANLLGGGEDADKRDYTIERLFAEKLRAPRNFRERTELHAAGADMQLTLCGDATRQAYALLKQSGFQGVVVMQDVKNGAVVAYTSTGTAEQAPMGIKRYTLPGSVFKLALSALWWDAGMGDRYMACPAYIQVGNRKVRNFESHEYPPIEIPRKMLVVSCNTQAIAMAFQMRQQLGEEAFADAYRRFGFIPYSGDAPEEAPAPFWNSASERWTKRMTPPPNRVLFRKKFNPFDWAQMAIGQGPVDVTPIAVSRFIQAIGNNGVMLQPTIEQDRLRNVPEGAAVMKPQTSMKLQRAMLQVVDSGTAVSVKPVIDRLTWDMGGKTGTVDIRRGQRPDGWFAGLMFGPDGRPRYTIVVYLQQSGQGGRAPAGLAAAMTSWMATHEDGKGAIRQPRMAVRGRD
ncbi:MAG TPA: penicillin-binding transpeptidase domain-containing protein [Longimicrobium sp.]|jgi:cell division protein FtsI/penicillin-binding protein 2